MRTTNPFVSLLAVLLPVLPAQAPQDVQGELGKTTRWSGVVRVTGDVNVPDGSRLEIAAGTKVWIADKDGLQTGWNKDRVEIHVKGQLVIEGGVATPVLITREGAEESGPASSAQPTWHGIVLYQSADEAQNRDLVRGLRLEYAFAGVQVPLSSPLFEDCVFRYCDVGVEIGSAHKDERFEGTRGGAAGPEIRRCRFTGCRTGVYLQGTATPLVEYCVFHACRCGLGSNRPGVISRLQAPGASLQRCAFVDCALGLEGCSLTRESIFADCKTALKLSNYHDHLATDIDQIVFERCLVAGQGREVVGDTAIAREVLRGEAKFRGPLADLSAPWPPLQPCLELEEGSAAIGAARDGGDLGPSGKPRPGAIGKVMQWTGKVLTGWRAAATDAPPNWLKLAKADPGTAVGKSWWASADQEDDGSLRLRRVFGLQRTAGLFALEVQANLAGPVPMQFSGETSLLEVAVNGVSAVKVEQKRRFGGASEPVMINLRAGANLIVVNAVGWGADPRIAFAMAGDWTPNVAKVAATEPTMTARANRTKDGVFVEISASADTHWSAGPGNDFARVQQIGKMDDPVGLDLVWTAPRKARLGPLPREWAKTEVELSFPGVRSVTGELLKVAPVTVKVQ